MKKDIVSMNDLYDSSSSLVFMVDFGEFHPAFKDAVNQVTKIDDQEQMELIHDAYSK